MQPLKGLTVARLGGLGYDKLAAKRPGVTVCDIGEHTEAILAP
jgi:hypothetical protein